MAGLRCPYCASGEGCRSRASGAGRPIRECRACGRVVEERRCEMGELFFERARDSPLCIVTPDFTGSDAPHPPPLQDDPFQSSGFITTFSTWSLELCPLFTASCTAFSGQLAELERLLLDPGVTAAGGSNSISMTDSLRAYFQIVESSSILGLERDFSDHALQLFRDCCAATCLRNRNIEALATAALVQAIREGQEARTLQEVSAAANIPQKEIAKYMKVLSDALKLSQPINSNSISVHMPRFCSLLQLNKITQDLATHIGEVVINKSFCTRRNPISISAASIYLACQLEDKKKTQTEICKATGLTEVTLRKVYKELIENLNELLPSNYVPAVPPDRAFPVSGVAVGRSCSTRTSITDTLYITPSGTLCDAIGASSSTCQASPVTLVKLPASMPSSSIVPNFRNSCISPMDGRFTVHSFSMSMGTESSEGQIVTIDSFKASMENLKELNRESEHADRIESTLQGELLEAYKILPALEGDNVGGQSSTSSPHGPSFFQLRPFMQEMTICSWPNQAVYCLPLQRSEGTVPGAAFNSTCDDAYSLLGINRPQIGGKMSSGTGDEVQISSISAPLESLHSMGTLLPCKEKQGLLPKETKEASGEPEAQGAGKDAVSLSPSQLLSMSNFDRTIGASRHEVSSMFQSFHQGLWDVRPADHVPSSGPSVQLPTQHSGMPHGMPCGDSQILGTEKGIMDAQSRDDPPLVTAHLCEKADALGDVASTGLAFGKTRRNSTQSAVSQLPFTMWPPPAFHHLFLPPSSHDGILGDDNRGCLSFQLDGQQSEAADKPFLEYFSGNTGIEPSSEPPSDMLPELTIGLGSFIEPRHNENQN